MPIDKNEFRQALGHFAAGVTIITTRGADGAPYGLTATAFSSVSLDPPLVLVCVDKKSETYPHFASGVFAVNLLTSKQEGLSGTFAKSGGDKFAGMTCEQGNTGAPLLADTLGYLECRIVHTYAGGDHTIFVGEVVATRMRDGDPLLYYRGVYRQIR